MDETPETHLTDTLAGIEPKVPEPKEALGIAWCDVYKLKETPRGVRLIKISLTSRSMISPENALKKLLKALEEVEKYGFLPYVNK